jgi:hypothetical protein
VKTGGNIVLDTGNDPTDITGNVTVYGNLVVKGLTSYIETNNVDVDLNLLYINHGDLGSGTGISSSLNTRAGLVIERGTNTGTSGGTAITPAQFLFNDGVNHYGYNASAVPNKSGTFVLQTGDGYLSGLQLRTITVKDNDTTDLIFDTRNTQVKLRVEGSNAKPYYQRISNSDLNAIPNLEYLRTYIASTYTGTSPYTQGQALVSTVQYPVNSNTSNANTSVQTTPTNIIFQVAQTTILTVDATGTALGNLKVGPLSNLNQISNPTTNNLVLSTSGSGFSVEIDGVAQLNNQTGTVTYTNNATKIYSTATVGPAKTGIYFTNSSNTTPDELISRKRAVLLSILL